MGWACVGFKMATYVHPFIRAFRLFILFTFRFKILSLASYCLFIRHISIDLRALDIFFDLWALDDVKKQNVLVEKQFRYVFVNL